MRRWLRPGDIALFVLLLLPLMVALPRLGGLAGPPELWLTWVGRVTGILGLAMLLLAGAVSSRAPGFDRPFGGLARLWHLHHWLGFTAFILVMVHVLALGLAAVPTSLDAAVATLFPPVSHGSIWLGWLAWLALVVFLAPTFDFFGQPHYQRWKRLHLVSAAALLLGLWHALLLAGEADLGDASHALQTVMPETRVLVEGPYGEFFGRRFPERDMLWLGGGVGITPFVGGARNLAAGASVEGHIHLFYLASDSVRDYYREELQGIAEAHEAFAFTQHYSRERGPLDEAFLREHCPDFTEREIFLCGPPAMNAHLQRLLAGQGVPASRIHSEVFDFL
ncbi:MAG: ferric reductase-like transmembrane domain-containing protein [Halomonas sp.]|nr:ferric reductase-like transmembrane domain-containing protein [Halomonas sp.]